MKTTLFTTLLIFSTFQVIMAQNIKTNFPELPYREIPEYPETYTPGTVSARMLDGLGYRYFWATEGLRHIDLDYTPPGEGRSSFQTLEHIYLLSVTILNAVERKPNVRPEDAVAMDFADIRARTLRNILRASEILKDSDAEALSEYQVIFQRGEQKSAFPFWNLINGQMADALYHTGQIVVFRRASGNPLDPAANVFLGKSRNR